MRLPSPLTWLERRALRRIEQRLTCIAEHDRIMSRHLDAVVMLLIADDDARRARR